MKNGDMQNILQENIFVGMEFDNPGRVIPKYLI